MGVKAKPVAKVQQPPKLVVEEKKVRPQTARPKPAAKPVKPKLLYPGLDGDLTGDPIAASIKDRVVVGGAIAEPIKEADAKKNGLVIPKQFKLAVKSGKDTVDLCEDNVESKVIAAKEARPETAKAVKSEPIKPAKTEAVRPSTAKQVATKITKKPEAKSDLPPVDLSDPIEVSLRAR